MHSFLPRDTLLPTKEEAPHHPFFPSSLLHSHTGPQKPSISLSFFFTSHARVNLKAQCQRGGIEELSLLAMQPTDSEADEPWSIQHRSLPIVITFIFLLFFIVTFFTFYLFRYVMVYLHTLRQRPIATPRGLPTSVISSFPTFIYSSIKDKDIQHGNDKPECTVCLAEFSDEDELRMLTGCSHVFHLECIDLWLQTHTTCPVCRRDLNHGNNEKVEVIIQMPESNSRQEGEEEGEGEEEEDMEEGEGEAIAGRHEHRNSFKEYACDVEGDNNDMDGRRQHREQLPAGQLSKSHSTGNSTEGKFRDGLHDQRCRSCTVLSDIEVRHSNLSRCEGSSNETR